MSVLKIRNATDDGWITIGGSLEALQQASDPGAVGAGVLWVDTDADPSPVDILSVATPIWTYGSQVATTSGTTTTLLTGIPSWVTEIEVMLSLVSTNGTTSPCIQIGDSGGFETSGYVCNAGLLITGSSGTTRMTSTFVLCRTTNVVAANQVTGVARLHRWDTSENLWMMTAQMVEQTDSNSYVACGYKTLSGELTQVRLNTADGTSVFDNGEARVRYR
jgi:hypothetical protein